MPNEHEALESLRALFAGQHLAVLCTHHQGQPFGNLVAFCVSDDLRYLVFATATATRKYRNLTADPRVALLIDSRECYPDDLQHAMAVTVQGRVVRPDDAERRVMERCYLTRHPQLDDFVHGQDIELIIVAVEQYDLVRHFQEVVTVRMGDG